MADIKDLNQSEQILLAGCIKAVILSDGEISESELDDLERINNLLDFADFNACLIEFEKSVKSEEDFQELARNVYHKQAQSLITQILWDLALQGGFPKPNTEGIIRKLQTWWTN